VRPAYCAGIHQSTAGLDEKRIKVAGAKYITDTKAGVFAESAQLEQCCRPITVPPRDTVQSRDLFSDEFYLAGYPEAQFVAS